MGWLKPLLLVIGLGHVIVGLYGLYSPDTVARVVSFELQNTGAYGEIRAVFGGMIVAFGVAILRGALGVARGRHWLLTIATAYTGMAVGRVFSLGVDGFAWHTVGAGMLEAALAVVLFWAGAEIGRRATDSKGAPAKPAPAPAAAPPTPVPPARPPADSSPDGGEGD